MDNYEQAQHWLNEADNRTNIDAAHECLSAAGIHAALAVADTVRDLTEELRRNQ
jgi:hypothetical protein